MSTLHCVPPPPPRQRVLSESPPTADRNTPVLLTNVHAVFDIIYETTSSSMRIVGDVVPDLYANRLFEFHGSNQHSAQLYHHNGKLQSSGGHHSQLGESAAACPSTSAPAAGGLLKSGETQRRNICVACCGLYQFLDDVYAPIAAALVRASPYLDSTEVATNMNCPRSMAFVWLASAVEYRRGVQLPAADANSCAEAPLCPSPSAIVPEEFSNFRDFYMGDVRNRVLRFLTSPCPREAPDMDPDVPGAALYRDMLNRVVTRRAAAASPTNSTESGKRLRDDSTPAGLVAFEDHRVPHLCHQALRFAALGTNGLSIDLDIVLPQCYEHLALPERYSGVVQKGSTNRGGLESIVPTQYGSNKTGAVMMYSLIYDHVLPYLKQERLGPFHGEESADKHCGVVFNVVHSNVYLLGLYRKMLRTLSQSPWFCEGQRIGTFSLQELIAEPFLRAAFPYGIPDGVLPTNAAKRQDRTAEYLASLTPEESEQRGNRSAMGVAQRGLQGSAWQEKDPFEASLENVVGYGWYKFHSAGREDVDVRMLGSGRPYVLELVSPHRQYFSQDELKALEAEVNNCVSGGVETESLRYTTSDITVHLARHSESKTKKYRCVVWCSRAITSSADAKLCSVNALKDLQVSQKTPLRVLHRRSLLDRPKVIHAVSCQRVNDHWLVVDLETQAGTYVKEFIHGDNGRTTPSLGELLGGRTDIIQLDVLGMTLPDEMDVPASGAC